MTDSTETTPAGFDFESKVRKMLDLAERASTEEERDAAMRRAQIFMAKYAIDEAMLKKTEKRYTDTIETLELVFTGIFAKVERELAITIARNSRCKIVISDHTYSSPKQYFLYVHGYTSDLATVKYLAASLQLQMISARNAWQKAQPLTWHEMPGFEKFKDRREFMASFTHGVGSKMHAAMRAAKSEAVKDRVAASTAGGYAETEADATAGVELALRDRADNVNDWFDKKYGNSLRSARGGRRAAGSYGAASAGRDAGRSADTGTARVGGGRRALER